MRRRRGDGEQDVVDAVEAAVDRGRLTPARLAICSRLMSASNKRYGGILEDNDVELEFDSKFVVLNRARLRVDGTIVDTAKVFSATRI